MICRNHSVSSGKNTSVPGIIQDKIKEKNVGGDWQKAVNVVCYSRQAKAGKKTEFRIYVPISMRNRAISGSPTMKRCCF